MPAARRRTLRAAIPDRLEKLTGEEFVTEETQPRLELKAVSKRFGGLHAVEDVNLRLRAGDRHGILGPNGAGKTTLFHLITGVLPVTSGRISLFGQDVTRWPTHQRTALGMARTFQITSLFPKLTVLDNVLLAVQGVRPMKLVMWRPIARYRNMYDKAEQLLTDANFWHLRSQQVRNLSHGEQRQLEVVLGLASDPKVLLLDEPSAGLATGESREMARFLNSLDPDLSILIIEHDLDVLFGVVSDITVLHYGKVLCEGPCDEVRTNHQVKEIYLGRG